MRTEAARRRQGETGKEELFQAEYPQKDLNPEPEPPQQWRRRLLTKGEREHLPLCSEYWNIGINTVEQFLKKKLRNIINKLEKH